MNIILIINPQVIKYDLQKINYQKDVLYYILNVIIKEMNKNIVIIKDIIYQIY